MFAFSAHGSMSMPLVQEEIVGYQPRPDDLDYPGKLQRRAEAAADGAAPPPAAAEGLPNAAQDDPEASVFACLSLRRLRRGRLSSTWGACPSCLECFLLSQLCTGCDNHRLSGSRLPPFHPAAADSVAQGYIPFALL